MTHMTVFPKNVFKHSTALSYGFAEQNIEIFRFRSQYCKYLWKILILYSSAQKKNMHIFGRRLSPFIFGTSTHRKLKHVTAGL